MPTPRKSTQNWRLFRADRTTDIENYFQEWHGASALHLSILPKARGLALGALGLAAIVVAPLAIYACEEETGSQPQDYTSLLQGLTDDVAVPKTADFVTQADALVASLKTLETTNDATSLTAAQEAWRSARKAYRFLDAEHYGPVTEIGTTDRVDTFPIDAAGVTALAAQPPADLAATPNHVKGFLGLEALLFKADALTDPKARMVARMMGEDIAAAARALADAWTTGGFNTQLKTAGKGSTRYATQRAALDDVMAGVGYALELVVAVDLANPLGRQNNGQPDTSKVQTALSDNALADMIATLDGVSAAYEGKGFNVITRSQSAPLDDTFRSQLGACKTKLSALARPFSTTLTTQTAAVSDAYEACKTAKNTWTTEVTSALGATVKPADTDGD